VKFENPGSYELAVKPKSPQEWNSIGLKAVTLAPGAKE